MFQVGPQEVSLERSMPSFVLLVSYMQTTGLKEPPEAMPRNYTLRTRPSTEQEGEALPKAVPPGHPVALLNKT